MVNRLLGLWLGLTLINQGWAAPMSPEETLRRTKPALHSLYVAHQAYAPVLRTYAERQGFRGDFEKLGTVVHEMIHIASAVRDGYFIDGKYFEPYAQPQHWPALTNKDIQRWLQAPDLSIITQVYLPATLGNGMGNILDEINAYTHVIEFICVNEPGSAGKQVTNLTGFLKLLEAYFRALAADKSEYTKLLNNRFSSGAVETLTERAYESLARCGAPQMQQSYPFTGAYLRAHRQRWNPPGTSVPK